MNRRAFLLGLVAAPAIVRVASIMPVKLVEWAVPHWEFASGQVYGTGNLSLAFIREYNENVRLLLQQRMRIGHVPSA